MTALGRRYPRVYVDRPVRAPETTGGRSGVSIPLLTVLGRMTLAFLEAIGAVSSFAFHAIRQAVQPP